MPVISPRRSSTSGSSSLYGSTTSARVTGGDSGSTSSVTNRYSSYFERAGSLSKVGSASTSSYTPSNYSSYLSSYSNSTYIPRTSAYRSSSSASSYLSGGSSALDNYRSTPSYLSSNDSTSYSRYGSRKTQNPRCESLTKDKHDQTSSVNRRNETKKPPTGASSSDKRLSSSCSSSSLARLVATSGLDIYEKYSPAHYKPNTELSRSRSALNATDEDNTTEKVTQNNTERDRRRCDAIAVTSVTLERPRSRYSRLYSKNGDDETEDTVDNVTATIGSRKKNVTKLTDSSSNNDVPTATFTLRSNSSQRASKKKLNQDETDDGVSKASTKSSTNRSSTASKKSTKSGAKSELNENLKKPPQICNGVVDDLASITKSQLRLSSSTSALNNNENDRTIERSASDSGNNGGAGIGGDESAITTANLDVPTMTTLASKNKIRSVATKSVLPPASPTTSRYWDRESNRTSSTLSSSYNHLDSDKLSSDGKPEGLCGLRNIGNTCFMNSIIQCLSHTNELTKFLRTYSEMRSSTSSKDQQILQEFAKLIREMWTSNVRSVTPLDLKRAFATKHRMYTDYNQQDAQEFLRFFLDSLHSALNSGVKGDPLKIDDNLSDNRKAEMTWEWYTRHENSLIRDLFVGQLKSTLRCTTCGNTSVTFDPFWDLSVSLPSSSRCKLDACLELFIREEVLDGDEMPTCAKCKTRRKCTKSFSIQRFPKYLVIHLKRFSETRWSKLSHVVEFPTGERELNMGPYGANANTNMYYSLYAISNHMALCDWGFPGSTAGGHYVALCKHPVLRKWHEFNDNIVSEPLSENHLVSSSAYILFYERA